MAKNDSKLVTKLSPLIEGQVPDFVQSEHPKFVRFLKHYYLHQNKLNKERRGSYSERKKAGICVRCKEKVVPGIVFCKFHQKLQKGYNKKARSK